jgi:hypothetical protein
VHSKDPSSSHGISSKKKVSVRDASKAIANLESVLSVDNLRPAKLPSPSIGTSGRMGVVDLSLVDGGVDSIRSVPAGVHSKSIVGNDLRVHTKDPSSSHGISSRKKLSVAELGAMDFGDADEMDDGSRSSPVALDVGSYLEGVSVADTGEVVVDAMVSTTSSSVNPARTGKQKYDRYGMQKELRSLIGSNTVLPVLGKRTSKVSQQPLSVSNIQAEAVLPLGMDNCCVMCSIQMEDFRTFQLHVKQSHSGLPASNFNNGEVMKYCKHCKFIFPVSHRHLKGNCTVQPQSQQSIDEYNDEAALTAVDVDCGIDAEDICMDNGWPHSLPELFQSKDALESLCATYGRIPNWSIHHSHKSLTAKLSTLLINRICGLHGIMYDINCVAFLILPAIISTNNIYKWISTIQLLRDFWLQRKNLGAAILSFAFMHLEEVSNGLEKVFSDSQCTKTQAIRRIEKLLDHGRCSSAMQAFTKFAGVEVNTKRLDVSQIKDIVTSLHPAGSVMDIFGDDVDDIAALKDIVPMQCHETAVKDCISKLVRGKAAGWSAWTNNLIQSLGFGNGEESKSFVRACTYLLNNMLSGTIVSYWWTISRCVLIPKDSVGDNWRPIGIGDVWYRLLGRVVLYMEGGKVGKQLHPLNLGCGTLSGSEIAARISQLMIDGSPIVGERGVDIDMEALLDGAHIGEDAKFMVSFLDAVNAFNTIPRIRVWKGLVKYAPRLCTLFKWAYTGSSKLYHSGSCVGLSHTGTKQGDPLSALFFCVGIHQTLLGLKEKLSNVCGGDLSNLILAYMDDVQIAYPPSRRQECEELIISHFLEDGLKLNLLKCKTLCNDQHSNDSSVFKFRLVDGKINMGCPVGTHTVDRVSVACKKIEEMMDIPVSYWGHLDALASYTLLRFCISARITYLVRVCEHAEMLDSFKHWDDYIDKCLMYTAKISAVEIDECDFSASCYSDCVSSCGKIRWLRGLPIHLGGLGIPRYSDVEGQWACYRSRSVTSRFVEEHLPQLVPIIAQSWPPIQLFGQVAVDAVVPSTSANNNSRFPSVQSSKVAAVVIERKEVHEIQAKRSSDLHSALIANSNDCMGALFLSSRFDGSGKWLMSGFGVHLGYPPYKFRPGEFLVALRTRMLIPPLLEGDINVSSPICVCQRKTDLRESQLHCFDCSNLAWYTQHRHNLVRDCVKECLQKTFNCTVKTEEVISSAPDSICRMDVVAYIHDSTYLLDISICNPASKNYRDDKQSHVIAGAAAEARDHAKMRHYAGLQTFKAKYSVIPLVFEMTGRPSKTTVDFFESLFKGKHLRGVATRLLARIGLIITRYNAMMVPKFRSILFRRTVGGKKLDAIMSCESDNMSRAKVLSNWDEEIEGGDLVNSMDSFSVEKES